MTAESGPTENGATENRTAETATALTVVRVETAERLQACFDVRFRVFVDEQAVPEDEELDAYDLGAEHFALEASGHTVVGTARLVNAGGGTGKVGRVAVLPEYRGRGAGRLLMEAVLECGFFRFQTLILDAQVSVIPFYEKLGFVAEGGTFLDCGIEHRRMRMSRPDHPIKRAEASA